MSMPSINAVPSIIRNTATQDTAPQAPSQTVRTKIGHRSVVKLDVSKTNLTSQKLLDIATMYPNLEELNVDECRLNGCEFFK